ncbi:tRNA (adenosine(37)-N6)-dimethylallyltransferase MiaA [Parvularcula lutaonensis]|uniref:tRNA dimethylallyltransferase n=1 Tax=Parvularcula lutaonensis TaxID=491923 RepID=A0ABV7MCK9_9PROT|nr:tRNA (adenosine(37)-N6)-dimethylallyltransferase MiaA [Parvularcula lutaonensis]GGY51100.1 tRNA dimethylallyltransferase [Parvularcula lutaonensis]
MSAQGGPPVVIVGGPTASGKSAAAEMLARMVGGEVINADSMQVYRDLRILSARPTASDQRSVPHHLYGHVDGSERYSAGRFVSEAVPIIEKLRAEGAIPVICGGTGLYLKSLTEGLSPIPEVPEEVSVRAGVAFDADPAAFRTKLLEADPAMERLEPNDRQRHVRAVAVLEATGRPLSDWQKEPRRKPLDAPFLETCLLPPRETLYENCDRRFLKMMEEGAVQEVRALMARGLSPILPVMKALGVPELAAFIRGDLEEGEAVEMAAQETRRFAKRQMTWFRNQTDWPVFSAGDHLVEAAAKKVMARR